jgi:hypothetical protein
VKTISKRKMESVREHRRRRQPAGQAGMLAGAI